ncbi:hypothetical protein OHR68_43145 [Spirillospora sp. NBC_00431]
MAFIAIPDPPAGPTEADEETVLADLYGAPCDGGIYHGPDHETGGDQ